jgi:type IV pilus assembly protein PilA
MNTLKKRKSGKKGFTLMEMLIVVAIIGILIAIMIPTFNNALTKARISADEANLRSYYAQKITAYMLDETANPLPTAAEDSGKSVTIDGQTYTLQAGTYEITADTTNDNFKITYSITKGSDKGKTVTIPGGAMSGGTTGDSDSTKNP